MVTVSGPPTQSAVDQVLSTTRCVRKGLDPAREVPRELIEDCLRVAMQAPIGSNGLYPHFVVVTDPAKRAAVAGFYKQAWDAYLPLPFSAANLHRSMRPSRSLSSRLRPTWPSTWRKFPHW